MKRLLISVAVLCWATTAQAMSIGDLAKIVLGNGAVLQKSSDDCPKSALQPSELFALSLARQAAQSALPPEQFMSLDTSASSQAVTAAQKPGFCRKTAKRKNVLLEAVKKAGQKLVTARVLGL